MRRCRTWAVLSCNIAIGDGIGTGRVRKVGMRRQFAWLASSPGAARVRTWLSVSGSLCLVPMLSGCIFLGTERPDIAIDIPAKYIYAGSKPYAALPTYEWWRRFRSRELTAFVGEAQEANFDIAAAVGRILQADAQARLAGAALLPLVNFEADAARSRPSQTTGPSGGVAAAAAATAPRGPLDRDLYTTALAASWEIDF